MFMNSRLRTIAFFFLLIGSIDYVYPRARLQPDDDAWIREEFDALVRAARAAYENDAALPP